MTACGRLDESSNIQPLCMMALLIILKSFKENKKQNEKLAQRVFLYDMVFRKKYKTLE